MRRLFLILTLLALPCLAAPGLDLESRLEQEADPLPFGKPVELILTLSWDQTWGFEPPAPETLELGDLTIIDAFATTPVVGPGRKSREYHLIFTAFKKGTVEVPGVNFDTPSGPVISQPLSIEFKGAEAKEGDEPGKLRGVKPVAELSTANFWRRMAAYFFGALALLAFLAALISHFRLLDRWLSPKRRALKHLNGIGRDLEAGRLSAEEASIALVELIREYLQRAYGLTTREATSREIQDMVGREPRSQHLGGLVKSVLVHGDGIKFAGQSGSKKQTQDLLEQTRTTLAQETRPEK